MTGGGVGTDDRDALAGWIEIGFPPCRVKRHSAEVVARRNLRYPRDTRRWVGSDDDVPVENLAGGGVQCPGAGVIIEYRTDDFAGLCLVEDQALAYSGPR